MTPREHAAAVTGLGLGLVTLGAVAALLHRTLRPIREIERYAGDIEGTIDDIAANVDASIVLGRARDTAVSIPALATSWLESSSR